MSSIVLIRPHTHSGKPFQAGQRLDVEGGLADWLIANGIARHEFEPDHSGKSIEPKTHSRKENKS
jgi:uncharacterized protein (DUF433 family)